MAITTRAKDPKIVGESQKIFQVIRNVFLWLVVILLAIVIVSWWRSAARRATEEAAKKTPVTATAQPTTKPDRTIEITAPVGRWSENVSIPLLHWFRIMPEGKVRIRLWNGKEMDSEPGNDTWFGDNILDANFRFQSREEQGVGVKILLRPK